VSQLVEVSTLSRTAVSHHLRVLRDAKILQSEKVGKEVFFWIDKEYMLRALVTLTAYVRQTA
jgi:DNA-binding transcriptional ArsR family regulator